MKKLLVLAALSAMALGAKAETTWYDCTFTLSDAKAVYYLTSAFPQTRDAAISEWNGDGSFTFLSDEMRSLVAVDTWDEFYKVLEGASEANTRGDNNGPYGKPTSNGNGNFTTTQCKNEGGVNTLSWLFLALTEETELTPGAAYKVYWGTSDSEVGDTITFDTNPIATGFLRTDASPAPEPTSGLLLLLGVAGLALKRKRA